jgi:hypothetical protein
MVGHHDGVITVYEPTNGAVQEVPESDFYNGHMNHIAARAMHVNSVALPGGS